MEPPSPNGKREEQTTHYENNPTRKQPDRNPSITPARMLIYLNISLALRTNQGDFLGAMKCVLIMILAVLTAGCNTLIGVGRDTKIGYEWVSGKIQNMSSEANGGSGGEPDPGGAPVY